MLQSGYSFVSNLVTGLQLPAICELIVIRGQL